MITKQNVQEIISLYEAGLSQTNIAKKFKCHQTNISYILRINKITTKNNGNQKYFDINTNLFKTINTEFAAYFLGFLYADGNIQTKNSAYQMTLKLKSNDQIILEKFRDILSPSSPIKITKNKGSLNTYSYFRINQKEVCEQLMSHGCMPNKSLILEFPATVPNELIRHFIRGYSDGDGCIYKNRFKNKKTINTIWKFVSTKKFCNKTAEILKQELGVNCSQSLSRPKTNQITTTLSIGGNFQVKKVLDWLYKDATIYLPRKYDKYCEFVNA